MKRKRKLLAILMAVAMAWQGVSFANADELTSPASPSTVTSGTETGSQGSPSEEDIRAEQAKQEAARQAAASAINATTGKAINVNANAVYVNKDNSAAYNNEAIDNYAQFGVSVDFTVPEGQSPKAGDTTTFQLSDSLRIQKSDNFDIKDGDQVVAKASIDAANRTVTLTYTNYVEQRSDIKGKFWLSLQVNSDKETEAKQLSTSIKVNNTSNLAIAGAINYTGITKDSDFDLVKDSWQNFVEETDAAGNKVYLIRYRVLVNVGARTNITLKDTLGEGAFSYYSSDKHPVSIRKGVWQRGQYVNGNWVADEVNGKNFDIRNSQKTGPATQNTALEAQYKAAVGKKTFTLNLGNTAANEGFEIVYYAKVDGKPVTNFNYHNEVELDSDGNGGKPLKKEYNVNVQSAGGEASGDTFKIKLKKVNEDQKALAGAVFSVSNSEGAEVGRLTTDANGEAILSGLLRGDYTVKEIQAPAGYILSDDSYSVKADMFDVAKVASLTVVNNKAEAKRNLYVTKKWVDAGDKAQSRPKQVTVELLRNGEVIGVTQELSQANAWKTSFSDLPKYDENSKAYSYTIREKAVEGYAPAISGTQELGFTLTNTISNKISIPVTKVWSGKGDHPSSVTVRLLADGKEIAKQDLFANNNWQYTFTNLERSKNGKEIQYTVTEDAVAGYTTKISGDAATGYLNVITNTKVSQDPNAPGNKGGGNGGGNGGGTPSRSNNRGGSNKPNTPGSVLDASREPGGSQDKAQGKNGSVLNASRNKKADGSVLDASRSTSTGDNSRALQYLALFATTGVGLFAWVLAEKKRKKAEK